MKTLQFTTHIENNAQLHLTPPSEYVNQDMELVGIIQPRKETVERQNWLAFITESYGCLADTPLERPSNPIWMKSVPSHELFIGQQRLHRFSEQAFRSVKTATGGVSAPGSRVVFRG